MNVTNPQSGSNDQGGVRALLRDATGMQHDQLNRHALLAGLVRPDYALATYQLLLQALFRTYAGLEPGLAAFSKRQLAGLDYVARVKLSWLQADLDHFGIDSALLKPADLPLPQIDSIGDYVGALYVVEGSTLGGQMIAKCLGQNLGLSADAGARFYAGYGAATTSMWRGFIDFAESIAADTAQVTAAQLAAKRIFAFFQQQFDLAVVAEFGSGSGNHD
ncbi:biliverdin-producing heme oxygenase [Methylomonas sp. EFPC3]|uniref:biliverdin-producing heme oxygenase n=1 Tax=Methylomonas sp. EFPC3 TaxID=3021710 RepID=UPI0024176569|nr:biliverdin-producing heme oxygenase [Methylomonas sp. EFPC3]WFP51853.1 biliverdin-producing heme oxygenase [Methylomonas sp. EFPC3]